MAIGIRNAEKVGGPNTIITNTEPSGSMAGIVAQGHRSNRAIILRGETSVQRFLAV